MFHKTTGKYYAGYEVFYCFAQNGGLGEPTLHCWYNGTKYILSSMEYIGVPLTVAGTRYFPGSYTYLGTRYYYTAVGYLWYQYVNNSNKRWIISGSLGAGTRETDRGVGQNPRWIGDQWYSLDGSDPIGTYIARGSLKETNPTDTKIVASAQAEGRECATKAGLYTPITGSIFTGNRRLGWMTLNYGTGKDFVEQITEYNNKPTFLDTDGRFLWHDTTNWIISDVVGTKDPLIGYWTCATLSGTYTRTFTGEGDPPTPVTYVLASPTYAEGTLTYSALIAQVATWVS